MLEYIFTAVNIMKKLTLRKNTLLSFLPWAQILQIIELLLLLNMQYYLEYHISGDKYFTFSWPRYFRYLNLSFDEGGGWFYLDFFKNPFTKNYPFLDHTLRHPCKFLILSCKKNSKKFSILKVLLYKWDKIYLFEQEASANDRVIGNAQLCRVKKIIMGISFRNLTGNKKSVV